MSSPTAASATGPSKTAVRLLDPETGDYERVPYQSVLPSLDGEQALVEVGDNSFGYRSRVDVLERATGAVRWIDTAQPGRRLGRFPDAGRPRPSS